MFSLFCIFSSVLPAGGLQLTSQGGDGLQTIAMTNAASAGGAIVHYAQGSDPQFIVPGKKEGDSSFWFQYALGLITFLVALEILVLY